MAEYNNPGLEVFRADGTPVTNATLSNPSKPLNQLASNTNPDTVESSESLYIYSLGIKDIQAKSIQYGDKQAYVTKPLSIPGNVMEIELEAKESHPLFDELSNQASSRQTSVEYYLSYKAKPAPSDWIPILPKDNKTVIGERLLPEENGECQLRFLSNMSSVVCYANGLKMAPGTFIVLSENKVLLDPYHPGTIYTVDYTPDSYRQNPWTFNLSDYKKDVSKIVDVFPDGTAYNKTVTLSHSPFLDLSQMQEDNYNPNTSNYKPVQVYIKDATIQGDKRTVVKEIQPYRVDNTLLPFTYNKTLYLDKSWSDLTPYSLESETLYRGFDYYQWKDKLTFTEHFNVKPLAENLPYTHGNGTIEVHYETLMTDFRLKIILRRNTGNERTVTPEVEQYSLQFHTIQ